MTPIVPSSTDEQSQILMGLAKSIASRLADYRDGEIAPIDVDDVAPNRRPQNVASSEAIARHPDVDVDANWSAILNTRS